MAPAGCTTGAAPFHVVHLAHGIGSPAAALRATPALPSTGAAERVVADHSKPEPGKKERVQ
jgi:hypothetical protein